MTNYGSDSQFSNNMMTDFRTFSQSQGYGSSIAPEEADIYSRITVTPNVAPFNTTPSVITFYDTITTDVFTVVQDPVIRNGNQVPTQNLLGIYAVALEATFLRGIGGATDLQEITTVLNESVFEMFLAGDRQFMAKGSQLINIVANAPTENVATGVTGLGALSPLASHVWPSTKLVMPGSTIRATLQIDGIALNLAATTPDFNLTLHVWAFNARR
jgi:hypothetical protein